ncbi:UNVERIFIED_CONTAM: hypothetical protein FKN15_076213 [Acipenser sinensis]
MRRLLLALCTVCALLPAVSTLRCHSCWSTTGPCTGTPDTCTNGEQQCLTSTSKEITGTAHRGQQIVKGCVSKNVCDSLREYKCCEGNLCNGSRRVGQNILLLLLLPLLTFKLLF